eukprot:1878165-Prymnesium_polylepis.1
MPQCCSPSSRPPPAFGSLSFISIVIIRKGMAALAAFCDHMESDTESGTESDTVLGRGKEGPVPVVATPNADR